MAKDYYKILEIDRNSNKDQIKTAFRKLAHKYHPDKNQNDKESEAKFKEINEAYQVLSDDNKRSQYDRFGSADNNGGFGSGSSGYGGFGGFDASSFEGFDFGNMGDIFSDFFGGRQGGRGKRGNDLEVSINISLKDSLLGVERKIRLNKLSKCVSCDGVGADKDTSFDTCSNCKGSGIVNEQRRTILGVMNTQAECSKCQGGGKIPKNPCKKCKGKGVDDITEEISVQIPAGVESGSTFTMRGKGEYIKNGISGDLYIRVLVDNDSKWKRGGDNLVSDIEIKLTDGILGFEKTIDTPLGQEKIKIEPGTNNGDKILVKGKGFVGHRGKGDMILFVKINQVKKLNKKQKELVEELKKEGL